MPGLTLLFEGIWIEIGPANILGMRLTTRLMGFYDRVAISRMLRWLAFSDRAAARRSIDELLTRPFDRLIVGHGTPLTSGGREAIADAFAWLTPRAGRKTNGENL